MADFGALPIPSVTRCVLSLGLALLISWRGIRRKSLSYSGAIAAVLVGTILTAASGCFCLALLAFFFTSSKLTRWKSREKKKLEYDHKEGGQRDWIQVLCNGGVATIAAIWYICIGGFGERPFYIIFPALRGYVPPEYNVPNVFCSLAAAACISSMACACGDTWASEVGSVIGGTPYLITRCCCCKQVPRGTNGGVTLIGVACSLVGGLVVGLSYFIGLAIFMEFDSTEDMLFQMWVIPLGGVAGFWGSLLDSLLGATVQYSGYSKRRGCVVHSPIGEDIKHISGWNILNNHAVNLASSALTAITVTLVLYVKLYLETLFLMRYHD